MQGKVSPVMAGIAILVVIGIAALALMKLTNTSSNKTEAEAGAMPKSAQEIFSKGLGEGGKSAPANANQGSIPGIPAGMMGTKKQ